MAPTISTTTSNGRGSLDSTLVSPSQGTTPAQQRAMLPQIEAKIARHRQDLEALEQQKNEIEQSLALLVYPVLTVPNEVISEIFIHCLPSGSVLPSRDTAPLLLAQICQPWRAIAISTPRLWSCIDISPFFDDASNQLLNCWLSRAKQCPLSLTFYQYSMRASRKLSKSIPHFAPQIRHLSFGVSSAECQHLPLPSFPRLEELETGLGGRQLEDLLKSAPAIHSLSLTALDVSDSWTAASSSLARLEIAHPISMTTFYQILPTFPRLSEFKCKLADERTDPPMSTNFPQLRSLSLGPSRASEMRIFEVLTLPNLQRLELYDRIPLGVMTSFIERSACALEHITINLSHFIEPAFIRCLQHIPSATTVDLVYKGRLNTALSGFSSAPSLLPQLVELTITTNDTHFDYDRLVDFIGSRRNRDKKVELQSLRLTFKGYDERRLPGESVAARLKKFIADGLKFTLQWRTERWPPETR